MLIFGFGSYDWENPAAPGLSDIFFHLKEGNPMVPSVEPQILLRPGTWPTFGVAQVGSMSLIGQFSHRGASNMEVVFFNLMKQLNPVNTAPRELRALRYDNVGATTILKINAVLAIPTTGDEKESNSRPATFVCVQPFWTLASYLTGTGGFT